MRRDQLVGFTIGVWSLTTSFIYAQDPEHVHELATMDSGLDIDGGSNDEIRTEIQLSCGRIITLLGEWTSRESMWPDASIVFRDDSGVAFIEGGTTERQSLYRFPSHVWRPHGGAAWSNDGRTYYDWLDTSTQLTAFDTRSGRRRSIHKLPTFVSDLEFRLDCNPSLVRRPRVLVETDSSLLILLQEFSNRGVISLTSGGGSEKRYQFALLDADGRAPHRLIHDEALPGVAMAWEFSHSRHEAYVLADEECNGDLHLVSWSIDNKGGPRLRYSVGGATRRIALSPDERWIAVERDGTHGDEAGARLPSFIRMQDVGAALRSNSTGYVVVDVDERQCLVVEGNSYGCTWNPADNSIWSYYGNWELWRGDVVRRKTQRIAWSDREPTKSRPAFFEAPVWTRDGRRLLIYFSDDTGANREDDHSILLDFARHEYLVLGLSVSDASWSPVARPFRRPV